MSGGSLRDQHCGIRLTFTKIFELTMPEPLVGWTIYDEVKALCKLRVVLGPLPEEWVVSLGMSASRKMFLIFNGVHRSIVCC